MRRRRRTEAPQLDLSSFVPYKKVRKQKSISLSIADSAHHLHEPHSLLAPRSIAQKVVTIQKVNFGSSVANTHASRSASSPVPAPLSKSTSADAVAKMLTYQDAGLALLLLVDD